MEEKEVTYKANTLETIGVLAPILAKKPKKRVQTKFAVEYEDDQGTIIPETQESVARDSASKRVGQVPDISPGKFDRYLRRSPSSPVEEFSPIKHPTQSESISEERQTQEMLQRMETEYVDYNGGEAEKAESDSSPIAGDPMVTSFANACKYELINDVAARFFFRSSTLLT